MKTKTALAAAWLAAVALCAGAPDLALAADGLVGARPEADLNRDAARKPAELVAFAGVKPGMKVADLLPGGGYFTRVFAQAVGPTGKVYAWLPTDMPARMADRITALVAEPGYANVTLLQQAPADFAPPEPLDVVWTAQNYHDLHNNGGDPGPLNAAIYKALKPGGVYVVVDHAGNPGTGFSESNTLHRIDPEVVKSEVTKAGFKFDGESTVLRRSDDPRTAKAFDLHDKTDQFVYRFRKPK